MSEIAAAPIAAPAAPAAPASPAAVESAQPVAIPAPAASVVAPKPLTLAETIKGLQDGTLPLATPHHSATQERNAVGEFAKPDGTPIEGAEGVDPNAPPAQGVDDPNAPKFVPFALQGDPNRGEEDIVIEFPDDPIVQERLRRLANGNMRRAEFEQGMQHAQRLTEDAQAFQTRVALDLPGVISEYGDREMMKPLVLSLLANDPEFLDSLRDDLSVLDDPAERRRVAAEAKLALQEKRDTAQTRIAQQRENRTRSMHVDTALKVVAPASMNDAQKQLWVDGEGIYIASLLQSGQLKAADLTPHNLPVILGPRWEQWGVSRVEAARMIAEHFVQNAPPARHGNGVPPVAAAAPRLVVAPPAAAPAAPAPAKPAAPSVQALQTAHAQRNAAAQTSGPGAGSPVATGIQPVPPGPDALGRTIKALKQSLRAS